jgi:hypothetical protein
MRPRRSLDLVSGAHSAAILAEPAREHGGGRGVKGLRAKGQKSHLSLAPGADYARSGPASGGESARTFDPRRRAFFEVAVTLDTVTP